ncbi:Major facilitator superfamily protein, putative [Theobroma cacao]|uniref:Major facilitator superfamily protein, putative n=1 Tax=Theobroma cacao TaxID=3641 RepID=A0A061DIQ5_THECC|nr:Major facilitator superfamily protein, putative [Theobroma cacao]
MKEAKSVMEIPSFQIIVAQGVCESIPWSALSFAPLWLDLNGFSHETQAFLMTLFVIAGSLGGLFGGRMGDMLAQFWENNSISDKFRFCNPSCCSFGVDITCDPFTAFAHGLVFSIMELSIS